MNEQYKNLIEKIKEVLPKEKEIDFNRIPVGNPVDGYSRTTKEEKAYNKAIQDCISSLPQVMEVIKGEIIVKINDSIIESDIVITHNKDILKIVDSISSKIITLLSGEDK